jgi:hypothetical protein
MKTIEFNKDGLLLLDSQSLNCVLQDISINGTLNIKSEKQEGQSGNYNIISGHEDRTIDITCKIFDIEYFNIIDVINKIQSLFSSKDYFYNIICDLLNSIDINQVVFVGVSPGYQAGKMTSSITMKFLEYNSMRTKIESQTAKNNAMLNTTGSSTKNNEKDKTKNNLIMDTFSKNFLEGQRISGYGQ